MIRTTTCALLLVLPAGASAQQLQITPFTARDQGLRGAAPMVGLTAAAYSGAAGLRLGAAMDAPSSPLAPALGYPPSQAVGAWSADVDLVFAAAAAGIRAGPLEPSLFTGFGAHGLRRSDGTTATIPVWSYGGGAALPLASWLSVDGEARYRMPHESRESRLPADVGGGWELRAGLSVRLGSTAPRPATRPAPVPRGDSPGGWPAGRAGGPGADGTRPRVGSTAVAALTLRTADRYVGVPYVWGGASPAEGFDCSGFVQYVLARNDIRVPRVSRDQARAGRRVAPRIAELREGDLLFFAGNDGVIDHVAMYAGDHTIIHAAASRGAVAYDRLDSRRGSWYATHLVAARRVIPDGSFWMPASP